MPRYVVQYVRGVGGETPSGQSALIGPERAVLDVHAPDRVSAYQAAVEQLGGPGVSVCVASRSGEAPLGFSDEEVREVVERKLSLSTDLPAGEAIQIESIEPGEAVEEE